MFRRRLPGTRTATKMEETSPARFSSDVTKFVSFAQISQLWPPLWLDWGPVLLAVMWVSRGQSLMLSFQAGTPCKAKETPLNPAGLSLKGIKTRGLRFCSQARNYERLKDTIQENPPEDCVSCFQCSWDGRIHISPNEDSYKRWNE